MADESKIQEIVSAYPFERGTTLSHVSLNQICEGLSNVTDGIETKQDVIEDLGTIRSNAQKATTALQPDALTDYYTKDEIDGELATKQDVIEDLGAIRSGATLGATAIQPEVLQQQLSNYLTETEVNELIAEINSFEVEFVDVLPESGKTHTIYFVPASDGVESDFYNEYMYINRKMELIGNTRIDLSGYYTKDEIDGKLATKQDVLTAGTNIEISGDTISSKVYEASEFDIKDLSDETGLRTKWDNKQDAITDLDDIRSGAALGATAVQESDLQTALNGYYTSGKTDELLATKQDVLAAGSHIEISGDTISVVGLSDVLYTSITHSELVSLVSDSGLTPGMQYRLTDYTTTVNPSLTDVQSAGHLFDIILVADDETTLNENVRFIHHEGDTYFADSDLSAWEGKYSLTNNTDKYAWADSTGGKGVIYWLKDEWNNECPYDFKNIQFNILNGFTYFQWGSNYSFTRNSSLDEEISGVTYYGYTCSQTPSAWSSPNCFVTDSPITTTSTLYSSAGGSTLSYGGNIVSVNSEEIYGIYTFSVDNNGIFEDSSLLSSNNIYGNVILSYIKESKLNLNRIWFIGINIKGNTFGTDCYNNSFGTDCYYNTFGNSCNGNTFGNSCYSNTFGNYFRYNTFGNNCWNNTFGNGYIKECRFGDGVQYCTISGYEDLDNYGSDYYIRNIIVLNGTIGQDGQLLELNENQIFNTHNFKQDGNLVPQIVCGFFINENDVMTYIAKYYFTATLG